jgi:2-oxoglutarate ferredoxin oxidoreductase subunit beta
MKAVFKRPESLTQKEFHFCPGCHHGIAHRLVAEVIDQLGIRERTIGIAPVGCAVFLYDYFNLDVAESPHGRAPAVATGIKRSQPEKVVFCYQGDGEIAAIGTAEIIHAANRGENISVVYINNAVYGMTGGQMAPTTIVGQKASTCPYGRDPSNSGYPIRMVEMLATLEAPAFLARVALNSPANVKRARKAIRKAFEMQLNQVGFSMVEVLSACPTNWRMSPLKANQWIQEEMMRYFPLGVYKEKEI